MSDPRNRCLSNAMTLALASGLLLGMGSFALPISAQKSVDAEESESAKKGTQS